MFDKYEIQIGKVLDGSNLLRILPLKTLKITYNVKVLLQHGGNRSTKL